MLNGCQQCVIGLARVIFDHAWNVFVLEHLLVALFSGQNAWRPSQPDKRYHPVRDPFGEWQSHLGSDCSR